MTYSMLDDFDDYCGEIIVDTPQGNIYCTLKLGHEGGHNNPPLPMTNTESQGAGEWEAYDMKVGLPPNEHLYPGIVVGNVVIVRCNGSAEGLRIRNQIIADHTAARELASLRETVGKLGAEAAAALEDCWLYTDSGDAIFGAFRQQRCGKHHTLAKGGICPVGDLRTRLLALTSPEEMQQPPEGLTPEQQIAWAESLPNAAGGAYTQEMTEAYTRAQFETSPEEVNQHEPSA